MKILLAAVNAKYIHSNPAIYSLRAYAGEKLREHIELAEYTINRRMQEILADLYRRKPDVIGFSCYIWNWNLIRELLTELPKLLPDTELWLGGPEVSFDADRILKQYPQLAGIMVGEGEATFRELAEYYVKRAEDAGKVSGDKADAKADLRAVSGLCLHSGYTSWRPPIDMNTIPFLYDDLTPFENRIIYYESSRGCPYSCSYCLSSIDRTVRVRDISIVKRELQFFLDKRVKQVKFVDRTFNCSHEHAMAVWRYLKENDNGVTNFHFEISADILREDELALLSSLRPGLAQLEIGVQSVNPDTLRAIRRVMDVERLERIVAEIHRGGNIHQHLDLIAGLPFEDYGSFGRSFDRVYRMRPEQLQLGFLKALKGSELWERAEEFGICYLDRPPYEVLYTRWLSYGDVLRLKGIEEMVELYYNSGQFTCTLPVLEKAFPGPFALFEQLAAFYEKRGYFTESPARAYRYQVFLEFAGEYDRERLPLYRELLTFDLYLRENLKSRPEFAADIAPHREAVRDFYRREERERRYLPDYEGYDWKQLAGMTHMEPLSESRGAVGDFCLEPGCGVVYALFDYRKKDPLSRQAAVTLISLPE